MISLGEFQIDDVALHWLAVRVLTSKRVHLPKWLSFTIVSINLVAGYHHTSNSV
jgi:hypothetical protein